MAGVHGAPALDAPRLAPMGDAVAVELPEGVDYDGDAVSEVRGERVPAEVEVAGSRLRCLVPGEAAERDHLWLTVPSDSGLLWIDFIVTEPVELSLDVALPARLAEGEALPVRAEVESNLAGPSRALISLGESEGVKCDPQEAVVELYEDKPAGALNFAPALPWQPGRYEVAATVKVGKRALTVTQAMTAEWEYPVVLDLMDAEVPVRKGFRPRGEDETSLEPPIHNGSFELTGAKSGGVDKPCIFTHPPYAAGRVGYVYGTYDVELPKEFGALLEFQMGLRDGFVALHSIWSPEVEHLSDDIHHILGRTGLKTYGTAGDAATATPRSASIAFTGETPMLHAVRSPARRRCYMQCVHRRDAGGTCSAFTGETPVVHGVGNLRLGYTLAGCSERVFSAGR